MSKPAPAKKNVSTGTYVPNGRILPVARWQRIFLWARASALGIQFSRQPERCVLYAGVCCVCCCCCCCCCGARSLSLSTLAPLRRRRSLFSCHSVSQSVAPRHAHQHPHAAVARDLPPLTLTAHSNRTHTWARSRAISSTAITGRTHKRTNERTRLVEENAASAVRTERRWHWNWAGLVGCVCGGVAGGSGRVERSHWLRGTGVPIGLYVRLLRGLRDDCRGARSPIAVVVALGDGLGPKK